MQREVISPEQREKNRQQFGASGSAIAPAELLAICRNAATVAMRGANRRDDRADCAADMAGDIIAEVTARHSLTRAALPLPTDPIVHFSHVVNRAKNWRRKRDRERENNALDAGADAGATGATGATRDKYATDDLPTDYVLAAGKQNAETARRATATLCDRLALPAIGARGGMSDAACALYCFVRDCDGDTAATELGINRQAFYARRERGARLIAGDDGSPALGSFVKVLSLLAGDAGRPMPHAGMPARNRAGKLQPEWCASWREPHATFALADESRPARGRTPILSNAERNRRDGTCSYIDADGVPINAWPARATDDRRDAADRDLDADELELIAEATARLGRALAGSRGRMSRTATGRTAGRPADKYAPRAVRLGKHAG